MRSGDTNKSLVQMAQDFLSLESALLESGGEITQEIEQMLEVKELNLPQKIDSYVHRMKRLEMIEGFYKEKLNEIRAVIHGIATAQDKLRQNIKLAMKTLQVNELSGFEYCLKTSQTTPTVMIVDQNGLPGEYLVTETITKVDKKSIARDLMAGRLVPGAELEQNVALRSCLKKP